MKKMYLLIVFVSACLSSFAYTTFYDVTQRNWRWRNNDGTETTATWKADEDKVATYNGQGVIRLRIEIVNRSYRNGCITAKDGSNCSIGVMALDTLQYSTQPKNTLSWKSIGTNAAKDFVIKSSGAFVTQGERTTTQIGVNNYIFYPGIMMVTDTVLKGFYSGPGSRTEYEWNLAATRTLHSGATYYFRMKHVDSAGQPTGSAYVITYPQGYPSLKIKKGVASMDFEAEPIVKSITTGRNTTLSVFPNPVRSAISFMLSNTNFGQVQAVLTGMDGRIVHRETFENVQANTPYKLSLSHPPAPGIYILKVTGNGLSESRKVMVE